jgi:hypothetical protein
MEKNLDLEVMAQTVREHKVWKMTSLPSLDNTICYKREVEFDSET